MSSVCFMQRLFVGLCLTAASFVAIADEPVLVQGPGIRITAVDVQADALRMAPEARAGMLTQPQTVSQMASNLYVRRALAQQALAQGFEQDPVIVAALQIARDKVLSDALLAKIDAGNVPSEAVAEAVARNQYLVKPERFASPERVQVGHILITNKTPDAEQLAEKTRRELKDGADFATLAKERSADTGSAAKGGELEPFARGRMVPEFEAAAFALKDPGQISDVVKTKFGYHILKLVAHLPEGPKPFAEVRDELMQEVKASQQREGRVAVARPLELEARPDLKAIEAFAASYGKGSR